MKSRIFFVLALVFSFVTPSLADDSLLGNTPVSSGSDILCAKRAMKKIDAEQTRITNSATASNDSTDISGNL